MITATPGACQPSRSYLSGGAFQPRVRRRRPARAGSLAAACGPVALTALLACYFFAAPAHARQDPGATVHGVVTDSITGLRIPAALVLLDDRAEVWSDGDGGFRFEAVPHGEYLLAAVSPDCRVAAARLRIREAIPLEVELRVGLQRLESATETAAPERSEGGSTRVVTRQEIIAMDLHSLPEILRRMAPGMVSGPSGQVGQPVRLRERGVTTITGSRTPLILLNGVKLNDTAVLDGIDPLSVRRIEIAPGAVGGWAHGTQGASGVIRIYTYDGTPEAEPYCGLRRFVS